MPGNKIKSKPTAYLLWFLSIFGWLGLHRFYLGKKISGLLWIFSGGVIGIGSLYDLFSMGEQVNQINKVKVLERLAEGLEAPDIKGLSDLIDVQENGAGYYCPYCKMGIQHIPVYQMKCPYCKNEIKIRSKQTLFPRVLLSKEEAAIVDHFKFMKRFHVSENDFIDIRNELSASYKEDILATDVFWILFIRVFTEIKDLKLLKSGLHSFALFLKDAEVNYDTVLQRAARMRLLELNQDFDKVRIIPFGLADSCPACKRMHGEVLTIAEALSKMPLPCKSCAYKLGGVIPGFCRCSYEGLTSDEYYRNL